MKVTIIILNWNAAADTARCLHAISPWTQIQPTIVVVDNGSSDGSPDLLARDFPQVHLIRNPSNQGFAGGNNRGIELALSMDTGNAPLLLLNNDAWLKEADVVQLLQTLEADDRLGILGPLLFDARQRDRLLAAGSKDPARHHRSHNQVLPTGGPVHIVECVPGTVVLVRAEIWRQVGLLDEDYFFASEVADLCLRARLHGYLSAVDARSRAYHDLGRSSDLRSTLHTYYIIRNRFLLIEKFHRTWKPGLSAFWTLYSLALVAKLQVSGNQGAAKAVRLGLEDGLRGRFGSQNERLLAAVAEPAGT